MSFIVFKYFDKKNYKKLNWNTKIQVLNKKKQLLTLLRYYIKKQISKSFTKNIINEYLY